MACNGIKISELEERIDLTGDENLVFQDGQVNGRIRVNTLLKDVNTGTFNATAIANDGDVAEANVDLENNIFNFSFTLPRGAQGEKGDQGEQGPEGPQGPQGLPGNPGELPGRTIFAFKASDVKPEKPQGGSWDPTTGVVTYPDGWSSNDSLEGIVWMSTADFNYEGNLIGEWSDPIRLTGENGTNGTDGSSIEFIYKLTKNDLIPPTKPDNNPSQTGYVPEGWTNHPSGISESMQIEWVCSRTKGDSQWSDWTEPTIWSKWGANGQDGDGVEYIYQRTKTGVPPVKPELSEQTPDYIPPSQPGEENWTDNPTGVDTTFLFEWVSQRKYNGADKVWGEFSNPALWAKYGEDGTSGDTIKIMYAKTSSSSEQPSVVKDNANPGSNWGSVIPSYSGTEAIWGLTGQFTFDNQLIGEWQGPYLITGTAGKDGTPVNYKTYVYKLSETKPNKPTGNDPENPGDGWVDYPNSTGQWWQCIGSVNGQTGLVTEWSEVIILNGRDGTAQDGKFTEFRFAKSTNNEAPNIDKSVRTPSGWTLTPPEINTGLNESLWMTKATINPDDTLSGEWSDPVRISGEQGPQGDTGPAGPEGPAGSQGVSGIPGKYIEVRYCLGTEDSYDGTYYPSNDREPSGWLLSVPTTTEEKPYIWFIQATITYADNDDYTGTVKNSWSLPSLLSGINGLPGATGPQGPQGVPGPAGADGTTYYTWIRYADDASGNGISNNPTGKEYIGLAYNKTTEIESNDPDDYTWSKIKGEQGNQGVPGPAGEDGQTLYTWIKYSPNPNGVPMTDTPQTDTRYIGIAVNKTTQSESNNANDYTWSLFKGSDGRKGQIIYPAGIYSTTETYTTDENKAPYVYDSRTGKFYILNTIMSWTGTEQDNKYPSEALETWTEMESYEAIYTKIGIIANGLIGSAVFNGDYMFSQQGGGTTGNFEDFNSSDPMNSSNEFIPNVCINFKTGEVWFSKGNAHFDVDGNAEINNITLNNAVVNGEINADSGKIGDWIISDGYLKSSDYVAPSFSGSGSSTSISSSGSGSVLREGGIIINGSTDGVLPASSGMTLAAIISAISERASNTALMLSAKCTSSYGSFSEVCALEIEASNAYSNPTNNPVAIRVKSGIMDVPGVLLAGRIAKATSTSSAFPAEYKYGKNRTSYGAFQAAWDNSAYEWTITHNLGHTNYTVIVTPYRPSESVQKIHPILMNVTESYFKVVFIDSNSNQDREQSGFSFTVIGDNY